MNTGPAAWPGAATEEADKKAAAPMRTATRRCACIRFSLSDQLRVERQGALSVDEAVAEKSSDSKTWYQ
jgi:hypothetical protein